MLPLPHFLALSLWGAKTADMTAPHPLVANGCQAGLNQFPYQVALYGLTNWVFCSGILISEHFVMTAAHCVQRESEISVAFGICSLENVQSYACEEVMVTRRNIHIHPNWANDVLGGGDIALLRLKSPLEMKDCIQPISLPTRQEAAMDLTRKKAVATGWGHTERSPDISDLRYTNLTILPESKCFGEEFICTDSSRGYAICKGDSGGPLIYRLDNERTILIGISSAGNAQICGQKGESLPSVFTRVGYFLDWISEITGIEIMDE